MLACRISRAEHWLAAALLLLISPVAVGQTRKIPNPLPKYPLPKQAVGARIDPRLATAVGRVRVSLRLTDPPLSAMLGANWARTGGGMTAAQKQAYLAQLAIRQQALISQVTSLGARVVGTVSVLSNLVIAETDAARVPALSKLPNVSSIRPVRDRQPSAVPETIPYIGALAAQTAGLTGAGVRVAVLDSGIDYTHRDLNGPGTPAAYQAAYGASAGSVENKVVTPSTGFPTSKVVTGYDFVGEVWPNGPSGFSDQDLAPDPNPIDFNNHGTHVADIIGGYTPGAGGTASHVGVAPGTLLHAVKVCSAVATNCNGTAILEGLDFAAGFNDVTREFVPPAQVVNLSLGAPFGVIEEDESEMVNSLVRAGIIVVLAAGNEGDHSYILGSPANAQLGIAVAETQGPSAFQIPLFIQSPPGIAGEYPNTAALPFAPITSTSPIAGNVVYVGRGCPASPPDLPAEDPYLANPSGKVALIDRGACNVSLKIDRAARAGATGVLLAMVTAGDPVPFSAGGGSLFVPSLVIPLDYSDLIKSALTGGGTVSVLASLANTISLSRSVVAESSRGPQLSSVLIKPDIAAPGATVSAVAGSATSEEAFGGTSGATPMVAGSAALLVGGFPSRSPLEIKAMLMNSAETAIYTNPATQPGVLAPVTRIGAGEVRVDAARNLTAVMWGTSDQAPSLSFGYYAASRTRTLTRSVTVMNYSSSGRTFSILTSNRTNPVPGAVTLNAPASVAVPPNDSAQFTVSLTIQASQLPDWPLYGGANTGNGLLLNAAEFDGYIMLTEGATALHIPWHVLPHKTAAVRPNLTSLSMAGRSTATITLSNASVANAGRLDMFALLGTSPRLPGGASAFPLPGSNMEVVDLRMVGVRGASSTGGATDTVQFALNTYGEHSHPAYPAGFAVLLDVDLDGIPDFELDNVEAGGFGASGQVMTLVTNLNTGASLTRLFAGADLNSSNFIFNALLADLADNSDPAHPKALDPNQPFLFFVLAYDNYFTGSITDTIPAADANGNISFLAYTLNAPVFTGSGIAPSGVPPLGSSPVTVQSVPDNLAYSPSQQGLLFLYQDAEPRVMADPIQIQP